MNNSMLSLAERMLIESGLAPRQKQTKSEATKDDTDTKVGVGVLVIKDGRILCGTRTDTGEICGPGGHIEAGESPKDAAVRETQEEFNITPLTLIPLGHYKGSSGLYCPSTMYFTVDFTGIPEADDEEMKGQRWLSIQDLENEKLFPPFEESIKTLLKVIGSEHIDGGPGSGNHNHEGREGQIGGSKPNKSAKERLADMGHSKETIQTATRLLDDHSGNYRPAQEKADLEISDHIAQGDEIGKYFSDKADMEETEWRNQITERDAKAQERYEEQLADIKEMMAPGGQLSSYSEEDLKDYGLWPSEPVSVEPKFYRKGDMNGDTLAFTTNPHGANMSSVTAGETGYIGSDVEYTLSEMNAMGYRPIAGIISMDVGQVGESEVLFSKFPSEKSDSRSDNKSRTNLLTGGGTTATINVRLDGGPGSGRYPKGSGGNKEVSSDGENKPCKGFSSKAKLRDHARRHGNEVGAKTEAEYEQKGIDFLKKPCGEDVIGYSTADGKVVRFNVKTSEYATGYPAGRLCTYMKPKADRKTGVANPEKARNYYEIHKKEDLNEGD